MSATEEFMRLVSIMERLRKECPWDRKQTPYCQPTGRRKLARDLHS